MVAKILDFRFFKSLKNPLSKTFCFPKFCKNFPEYPPEITIRTWIIVYLIPKHFSWFKNCKILILVCGASFTSAKMTSAFVHTNLLLMMKMVDEKQEVNRGMRAALWKQEPPVQESWYSLFKRQFKDA